MRIFSSAVEAVKEVERDLVEMGIRVHTKTYQDVNVENQDDFDSKEIHGYSFTLTDGTDWRNTFAALGFNDISSCIGYSLEETYNRLYGHSNLNPGTSWLFRKDPWQKFLETHGDSREDTWSFSYTYPERIHDFHGSSQMVQLKNLLDFDLNTRQGIIQIYDQVQDGGRRGHRRVPCTMYYQVLVRNDILFLIHNMRSCDLYTHFPIDLSISWLMANHMAANMRKDTWKPTPRVIMQIGSLHAFKKDYLKRGVF